MSSAQSVTDGVNETVKTFLSAQIQDCPFPTSPKRPLCVKVKQQPLTYYRYEVYNLTWNERTLGIGEQ